MTAATHVGALFARANAALLLTPPTVEVRIDGLVEPRLRLRSIQQEMGSAPTATFEAALGRDVHTGQTVRLEDLAADIRPGAAVTATLLRGGVLPGEEAEDLVLFDGRIVQADLALTSDGEHALLEAEDPTADLLRRRLGGQRAWTAGEGADRVDGRPPAKTHFAALRVRMDFAAAPRRYVARGDCRLQESTFDLVAGWEDSLATSDPDDFSPRTNPDFDDVRDVFRKWVLNEDGAYSGPPYDRGEAPDLSDLFEGTPYVRRHRRLLPCLSRDGLSRSRGVYVEISLDGGTSWEQSTLAARVLRDECGLYLTEDPLPSRYLAAAMRGQVCVRATATVESDALLAAEYAGAEGADLPGRTRHVNVPAGYRYRRVAPTSRFHGEGGADEVDDTARLQDLIRAAWDADRRAPAPARIEVPYLALGHRVGQRLLGTRGRRLALAREHTGFAVAPVVRGLRLTFAPAPRTELILE